MPEQVTKLIIDPIPVDKLSEKDINVFHLTDNASAVILLPNGTELSVAKSGGTFDVTDLSVGQRLRCKLYIYDRQPKDTKNGNGWFFTVHSEQIKAQNGIARMHFEQMKPVTSFHLINS